MIPLLHLSSVRLDADSERATCKSCFADIAFAARLTGVAHGMPVCAPFRQTLARAATSREAFESMKKP